MFGCVLEALDGGKTVSLSLPLNVQNCSRISGRISSDLLRAQRRERHLCSCHTSEFSFCVDSGSPSERKRRRHLLSLRSGSVSVFVLERSERKK